MKPAAFQLRMEIGPTPELVFDLVKPELSIGRDLTNDLVINEAEISRKHALLKLEAGTYMIEDLVSTNGTFINGKRLIGPHSLNVGEVITLGENVRLVYETVRPELAATRVSSIGKEIPPFREQPQSPPPAQPAPFVSPQPDESAFNAPPYYPLESELEEPTVKRRGPGLWFLAGFGCLVLLAVACAAAVLAIEYFDLWCTIFGGIIPGC